MSARLTVQETADFLRTLDGVLILTHVRPDGDTVGCAAALCRALRALGRTAYLLENPEITETYTPYAEGLWAPEGFVPQRVVSVDIAALNLLPENAVPYKNDICLAIDHHGSQEFFAERTCLDAEAAAITAKLPKGGALVALCIEGTPCSSEEMSRKMQQLAVSGKTQLTFLIGGSVGLSESLKRQADWKLSMSPMTFPHHLARVMLLEQIYRAFQIRQGTKYHK